MRSRPARRYVVSISLGIGICAVSQMSILAADNTPRTIVAVTPEQVQWFTPSYYTDGRQRAQLIGDSSKPGPFVDRVKIPSGGRVRAHTHPDTEMDTVIAGTWYVGMGDKFDKTTMKALPAGGYALLPAEMRHYALAKTEATVQVHGMGPFALTYVNPGDDPSKRAPGK